MYISRLVQIEDGEEKGGKKKAWISSNIVGLNIPRK